MPRESTRTHALAHAQQYSKNNLLTAWLTSALRRGGGSSSNSTRPTHQQTQVYATARRHLFPSSSRLR